MNPWRRRGVPVRGSGDPPFYAFCRVVAALLIVPLYRYRAGGGEHVPDRGGVILAVSHKSWADPVFAAMAFRRPLRFMAKSEVFANRLFGRFVTALGAFSIRRGAADVEAVRTALDIIASGGVLLMFPEGTRRHDDQIHELHAGIGMLALRSGAPVIPVALKGTRRLVSHRVPRFPSVRVNVGQAVDLSGLEGRKSEMYAAAAERIRAALRDLYVTL